MKSKAKQTKKDKSRTEREKAPEAEMIATSELKPHPRNYRAHPEHQLDHIGASLKQHGFYRNVVVAKDNTILAGHGVVKAAEKIGIKLVPVLRLNLKSDDPRALKILASDNELGKFSENNEQLLTQILQEIRDSDPIGLFGTGYDDRTLGTLLSVNDPTVDPMSEWNGMPEFDQIDKTAKRQIVMNFKTDEDADQFGKLIDQNVTENTRSLWYPKAEIERLMDKRYKRQDA